jgi:hypothetical protein
MIAPVRDIGGEWPLTKGLGGDYAAPGVGLGGTSWTGSDGLGPRQEGKIGMSGKSGDRKARLAAALRENLKRRKARTRALVDTGRAPEPAASDVGAETPATPRRRPNPAAGST